MRKSIKSQCARETEKGFLFFLLFLILALGALSIHKIMTEEKLSAMMLADLVKGAECFLSPWTGYAVQDENSWEERCVRYLSPYLKFSEVPIDVTTRKEKGSDDGKEEVISQRAETIETIELEQLLERENGAMRWKEDFPEKETTDSLFEESLTEERETSEAGISDDEDPLGSMPRYEKRTGFRPHSKENEVNLEELQSYENLVKRFYTIDPTTMAGSDQLNVKSLMEKDLSIKKGAEGPQILIYHTHSREAFCDSDPNDPATSIVGIGEELANILREDYGFLVLHHTGTYDVPSRNEAYSRALPEIERILQENPTIEVVIDLHRDEMPENTRLVTEIDGRKTAKFMFFNGLSRTKRTGNLDYLYNVYQQDNLAFSFQMEKAAQEYYPGLTRKIYLKGYRYNMHLMPRTLLIELGAQNNTVEEALNACGPLAHLLNIVLSGEE